MTRLRITSVLAAAVMAVALFAAVASAQGVTVFTGTVTLDGAAAPAGTTVTLSTSDGTVIGSGTTGAEDGQAADTYRADIQATAALEGQTIDANVAGTGQVTQASGVFSANRAITVNVVTTSNPTPTPTPVPTATPIVGPAGPAGPAGPEGPAGSDGATGGTGDAGSTGSAGATGPAGAIGLAGEDASSALGVVALILGIVALVGAGGAIFMAMQKRE